MMMIGKKQSPKAKNLSLPQRQDSFRSQMSDFIYACKVLGLPEAADFLSKRFTHEGPTQYIKRELEGLDNHYSRMDISNQLFHAMLMSAHLGFYDVQDVLYRDYEMYLDDIQNRSV